MTAFRAALLRCSGVILAALAGPPFRPPFRPSATACGFFATPELYTRPLTKEQQAAGITDHLWSLEEVVTLLDRSASIAA